MGVRERDPDSNGGENGRLRAAQQRAGLMAQGSWAEGAAMSAPGKPHACSLAILVHLVHSPCATVTLPLSTCPLDSGRRAGSLVRAISAIRERVVPSWADGIMKQQPSMLPVLLIYRPSPALCYSPSSPASSCDFRCFWRSLLPHSSSSAPPATLPTAMSERRSPRYWALRSISFQKPS